MLPRVLLGDGGCPSGLRARGTALSPVDQGRARRPRAGRHLGLGHALPAWVASCSPPTPPRAGRIRRGPQHPAWCPVQCAHLPPPEAEGGEALVSSRSGEGSISGPRVLEQPWMDLSKGSTEDSPSQNRVQKPALLQDPGPPRCLVLGSPLPYWPPGPPHTGGGAAVGRPLTHKAYFLPMQQPRVYSTRKQMESR